MKKKKNAEVKEKNIFFTDKVSFFFTGVVFHKISLPKVRSFCGLSLFQKPK
jgi:hypothetical protein